MQETIDTVQPPAPEIIAEAAPLTEAERNARTEQTRKAIAYEYKTRLGVYKNRLLKNGIPPHDLDDAVSELFELALRYAASYDPAKAQLQSWIGNAIGRTVASTNYGTRQPQWKRSSNLETTVSTRPDYQEESDYVELSAGVAGGVDLLESVAVCDFISGLAENLSEGELLILEKTGLCIMSRLALDEHKNLCAELGVSPRELNNIVRNLRIKVHQHATAYFDAKALIGRVNYRANALYPDMSN